MSVEGRECCDMWDVETEEEDKDIQIRENSL